MRYDTVDSLRLLSISDKRENADCSITQPFFLKSGLLLFLFFIHSVAFSQGSGKDEKSPDTDSNQTVDTEQKERLKALLHSKQIMQSSMGLFTARPLFLNTPFRTGNYKSIWYNDSYFTMGFGMGSFKGFSRPGSEGNDALPFNDFSIGANIPLHKLSKGRRLWDISGVLFSPQIGIVYNRLQLNSEGFNGIKLIPTASLQFPYGSIDARLNIDVRGSKGNPAIKGFAVYPEIGLRLDGLFQVFDPDWVNNGHYEGTKYIRGKDTKTTSYLERHLDGSSTLYEVTVTTDYIRAENYNFDAMVRNVGPFVGLGPRLTMGSHLYSGKTFMAGIGYHMRMPMFGADFMADAGKLGFASSYLKNETVSDPKPSGNKLNKKDSRFTGTYTAGRIGGRGSVDLWEWLTRLWYKDHSDDAGLNATKFTRLMGGIGGGYAFLSQPSFEYDKARPYYDSLYQKDYTILTSGYNSALYGESTPYFTWFVSFEVGAVQVSMEWFRYKYAPLANVQTISVGYMLPYKRLIKRYRNLKSIKRLIQS